MLRGDEIGKRTRGHAGWLGLLLALATLTTGVGAVAAENMIGRQSQNEGIFAVPTPGPVVVDGNLDDWDLSGQIWTFADIAVRDRFSVRTAAMWSPEALYLSFYWKDPAPLFNTIDPDFNPDFGWRADSVQFRIVAGGQTGWFTTWYHTPSGRASLHREYWKNEGGHREGTEVFLLVSKPGETDLGEGVQLAYKALPEGDGFIQEFRIPWRHLYRKTPDYAPAAGDLFKMGMEFLWGDPTGNAWPVHRYADNMMPGATSREFFWSAKTSWGEVKLLASSEGLEPRRYVSDEQRPEGLVPVRAQLPIPEGRADAVTGFTLVIDNAEGRRVRNLAGDFDPRSYQVKDAPVGLVEVLWDGTDDAGKLVAAGEYVVRGLTHGPVGADFERTFYNPGTPTWHTPNGRGGWGADHANPQFVARAGDGMALGWFFAEGGSGLIGVGRDTGPAAVAGPAGFRKQWGESRGMFALAGNSTHIFVIPNYWNTKAPEIARFRATNGQYAPFKLDGKVRPFELPIAEILAPLMDGLPDGQHHKYPEETGDAVALAANDTQLAVLFANGFVALLNAESALLESLFAGEHFDPATCKDNIPDNPLSYQPTLAFSPDNRRVVVSLGGRLYSVLLDQNGAREQHNFPGLGFPGAVAFDADGTLWVFDRGPDQQLKGYDLDGTLRGTAGLKGGRPARGKYDPRALKDVSQIAVDADGLIWAAENTNTPRRVSLWSRADGTRVRDFIGNTGYAGTGVSLHDQDPTRGYIGPVEVRLDPDTRDWRVESIVWVPDRNAGEHFDIPTEHHSLISAFYSDASGQRREYMFVPGHRDHHGYVLFMNSDNGWRPVSAIGTVGMVSGKFRPRAGTLGLTPTAPGVRVEEGSTEIAPDGDFAGKNLHDGMIWNDHNGDGKVQFAECAFLATPFPATDVKNGRPGIPLQTGWGVRLDKNTLAFYANSGGDFRENGGMTEYKPLRFAADGAPVYGLEGMRLVNNAVRGELVPVPGRPLVILATHGRLAGVDRNTGEEIWTYPNRYHHVHGSHLATMPRPGLIIGPLKNLGIVDADKPEGGFFALRGNLGQDFYMTTDGLYIAPMFLDARLPGMALPANETEIAAMPMEMFTNGQEPFNGWLGRQEDGVLRMTNGILGLAGVVNRIRGLDSVQRLANQTLAFTEDQRAAADRDNALRQQAAAASREYLIRRKPGQGWQNVPELSVAREGQPSKAKVQLAYNNDGLHARFVVDDPTPWKNAGKDASLLFKTGDSVDIQLSPAGNTANSAKEGDVRIMIAPFNGKPTVVLMRQVEADAPEAVRARYTSPVMNLEFARVEVLPDAKATAETEIGHYTIEAFIPWKDLGFNPAKDATIRGDVGFILSDETGQKNVARVYFFNEATNLTNDVPGEARLEPARWGVMRFE